jgi:8-oxo-dGTP diphosphatase
MSNSRCQDKLPPIQQVRLLVECLVVGFDGTHLYYLSSAEGGGRLPFVPVGSSEPLDSAASQFAVSNLRRKDLFFQQVYSCDEIKDVEGNRSFFVTYVYCVSIMDKGRYQPPGMRWSKINLGREQKTDTHKKIDAAIRQMQNHFNSDPGRLTLLPEKFTITQLCRLYESLFYTEVDVRNFRKKIMTTDCLIKLDEKERTSSRRGAFFYSFKNGNRGKSCLTLG